MSVLCVNIKQGMYCSNFLVSDAYSNSLFMKQKKNHRLNSSTTGLSASKPQNLFTNFAESLRVSTSVVSVREFSC